MTDRLVRASSHGPSSYLISFFFFSLSAQSQCVGHVGGNCHPGVGCLSSHVLAGAGNTVSSVVCRIRRDIDGEITDRTSWYVGVLPCVARHASSPTRCGRSWFEGKTWPGAMGEGVPATYLQCLRSGCVEKFSLWHQPAQRRTIAG